MASGVGRFGAILGPTIGGILLTMALPIQINFLVFAIPGFLAALALVFIPVNRAYDYQDKTKDEKVEANV